MILLFVRSLDRIATPAFEYFELGTTSAWGDSSLILGWPPNSVGSKSTNSKNNFKSLDKLPSDMLLGDTLPCPLWRWCGFSIWRFDLSCAPLLPHLPSIMVSLGLKPSTLELSSFQPSVSCSLYEQFVSSEPVATKLLPVLQNSASSSQIELLQQSTPHFAFTSEPNAFFYWWYFWVSRPTDSTDSQSGVCTNKFTRRCWDKLVVSRVVARYWQIKQQKRLWWSGSRGLGGIWG